MTLCEGVPSSSCSFIIIDSPFIWSNNEFLDGILRNFVNVYPFEHLNVSIFRWVLIWRCHLNSRVLKLYQQYIIFRSNILFETEVPCCQGKKFLIKLFKVGIWIFTKEKNLEEKELIKIKYFILFLKGSASYATILIFEINFFLII